MEIILYPSFPSNLPFTFSLHSHTKPRIPFAKRTTITENQETKPRAKQSIMLNFTKLLLIALYASAATAIACSNSSVRFFPLFHLSFPPHLSNPSPLVLSTSAFSPRASEIVLTERRTRGMPGPEKFLHQKMRRREHLH